MSDRGVCTTCGADDVDLNADEQCTDCAGDEKPNATGDDEKIEA